ncbi:hypothetical protein AAG906_009846 [Vitis piasezkii]
MGGLLDFSARELQVQVIFFCLKLHLTSAGQMATFTSRSFHVQSPNQYCGIHRHQLVSTSVALMVAVILRNGVMYDGSFDLYCTNQHLPLPKMLTQVIAAAAAGVAAEGLSPKDAKAEAENAAQLSVALVENSIVVLMLVEDHLRLQSNNYSNSFKTIGEDSTEAVGNRKSLSGGSGGVPLDVCALTCWHADLASKAELGPSISLEHGTSISLHVEFAATPVVLILLGITLLFARLLWDNSLGVIFGAGLVDTGDDLSGSKCVGRKCRVVLRKKLIPVWINWSISLSLVGELVVMDVGHPGLGSFLMNDISEVGRPNLNCAMDLVEGWKYRSRLWYGVGSSTTAVFGGGGIKKSVTMLQALLLDESGLGGGLGIGGGSGTGMEEWQHFTSCWTVTNHSYACYVMVLVSMREEDDGADSMLMRNVSFEDRMSEGLCRQAGNMMSLDNNAGCQLGNHDRHYCGGT